MCVCVGVVHMTLAHPGGAREPASHTLMRVLEDTVMPMTERLRSGPLRGDLQSDAVQAFLFDHIDTMRNVFKKYSAVASDQGIADNVETMSLDEYALWLRDSALLGEANDEQLAGVARHTFAASQQYDETADAAEREELVFSEFVEALARYVSVRV
jgi:hypothetical protein